MAAPSSCPLPPSGRLRCETANKTIPVSCVRVRSFVMISSRALRSSPCCPAETKMDMWSSTMTLQSSALAMKRTRDTTSSTVAPTSKLASMMNRRSSPYTRSKASKYSCESRRTRLLGRCSGVLRSTLMKPSAVRSTLSSINRQPMRLSVVSFMCITISRSRLDLPRPLPAAMVTSSVGRKPYVNSLSLSQG